MCCCLLICVAYCRAAVSGLRCVVILCMCTSPLGAVSQGLLLIIIGVVLWRLSAVMCRDVSCDAMSRLKVVTFSLSRLIYMPYI